MVLPFSTQLSVLRGPAIARKKLKSMRKFEMIKQALGFCLKRLGNFGKLEGLKEKTTEAFTAGLKS